MSKSFKISICALVVIIGLFVGISVYVSSQINPELIRKEAIKVLSTTFPNANVKLEKLDYSLGTNVSFNIDNFSLDMKKGNANLIKVSKIKVKIPLLSILTSGGNIDVIVNSPKIGFTKYVADTNWDRAMGTKPNSKKAKLKKTSIKKDNAPAKDMLEDMPSFIKKSKINLKVVDASVDYSLDAKTNGNIIISKVIIKNINVESSAAFEIASIFKMTMGKDQVSSNILVVGDFNIKKFLKSQEVSSNVVIKLLKSSFGSMTLPTVQAKIKAEVLKSGLIKAGLNISVDSMVSIIASASVKGDAVNVSDIDFGVNFENTLKYLKDEMDISVNEINANKSELHLRGKLSLNLKTMKLNPDFDISTTKPLKLIVSGLEIATSFGGAIKGKNVSFNVKNQLFSGVMTASVKTKVDPMNLPKDLFKYSPVYVDIKATGFHIERPAMQKLLYSGEKVKLSQVDIAAAKAAKAPPVKEIPAAALPPIYTNIDFDQCYIGKDVLKIKGKIPFENNVAKTKGITIDLGKGHGKVTFNTQLKSNVRNNSKFDFSMKNLNFSTFSVFLPPTMERIEGYFTGKANGVVNMKPEGLLYNVTTDVVAGDGKVKGLHFGKIVGDLAGGLKDKLKGKINIPEDKDIPDGFKKLIFKGQLTEKLINIKKFLFYGVGDKIFIQSVGKKNRVSMLNKNSSFEAELKYPHGKAMSELKKRTGLTAYPLLLKGKGFALMPDIGYTVGKLTSGVAKKAVSKQKKKVKKAVKKKVEDLKKNLLKKFKLKF